jgi:hypothetical protein
MANDNLGEGRRNQETDTPMIRKPYCFSQKTEQTETYYFGIQVQILDRMEHSSLIQYGDLKVVVDTQDLVVRQVARAAA